MNAKKITGTIVLVVGIALLIVFATADLTGLGINPTSFGYVQVAGVIAGAVVSIGGLILLLKRQSPISNG
jgi:hypothetical protein